MKYIYLDKKYEVVGQAGMLEEINKAERVIELLKTDKKDGTDQKKVNAEYNKCFDTLIRVNQIHMPKKCRMAQGLHEVVPVNMSKDILKIEDQSVRTVVAQVQSGLRTSVALTVLTGTLDKSKKPILKGHTGTFLKPSKPGSKNMFDMIYHEGEGPGSSHDTLRTEVTTGLSKLQSGEWREEEFLSNMASTQIGIMPHGKLIMGDGKMTDLLPNWRPADASVDGDAKWDRAWWEKTNGGEKLESPDRSDKSSNRFKFASEIHSGRETMKCRVRKFNDAFKIEGKGVRPVSPSRTPIEALKPDSGKEGDHPWESTEVPLFSKTFPLAQMAAWISQPMRMVIPPDGQLIGFETAKSLVDKLEAARTDYSKRPEPSTEVASGVSAVPTSSVPSAMPTPDDRQIKIGKEDGGKG